MDAISYTTARTHLAATMERVCNDHLPVIITRQNKESVVLMSLEDYESIAETIYLVRNPKNAQRLSAAIGAIESGKSKERDLFKDEDEN